MLFLYTCVVITNNNLFELVIPPQINCERYIVFISYTIFLKYHVYEVLLFSLFSMAPTDVFNNCKRKTPRNITIRTINTFNRKDITNKIIIFTINQCITNYVIAKYLHITSREQLRSTNHNM